MPATIVAHDAPADRDPAAIEVGVLNLLADGALPAAERQLRAFFDKPGRNVRLRFFTLASVTRGATGRRHIMAAGYGDGAALKQRRLHGLFVTGAEPHAAHLTDEPFWDELTTIIDWAAANTRSTIWSCLAAHAAILHLDCIERQRMPAKLSGIFDFARGCEHDLMAGTTATVANTHSRWNDVAPEALLAAGYTVLTSGHAGVDCFTKDVGSTNSRGRFVFLQGHPEYDEGAIGREYRRDVLRALSGGGAYPSLPQAYFDAATTETLRRFEADKAMRAAADGFARFPVMPLVATRSADVHTFADQLSSNWLGMLTCDHNAALPKKRSDPKMPTQVSDDLQPAARRALFA